MPAAQQPHPARVSVALVLAISIGGTPVIEAGDILRGGTPAGNAAARSEAINRATAEAAAAARASARDSLARTNRALQGVKDFQAAARAAAAAQSAANLGFHPHQPGVPLPNVPDGLATGGLEVDPGVLASTAVWSGASLPVQAKAGGRTNVTIKQTQSQALLSWRTFNVGKNTTLRFDQSAGEANANKWIAFNKVNDPSGVPSQILGNIQAPGQVYVINRNGIIFGGASQVNVGTLVASSLPINDNLINNGLLNNPDAQFLFSGLAIPAGANGTPAFTPEAPPTQTGRYGDVIVQPGARLTSPTNDAGVGGRIMLVGPNVRQQGTILTPDGQAILAAGLQVGIEAHSTDDPSLRGLDVFIGAIQETGVARYAGAVTNRGLIEALRGNITLAGAEVNQLGALESSTTVSLNGRIDLLASYDAISNPAFNPSNPASGRPFLPRATGTVRFGAGSVTRVLPEIGSEETVNGRELALRSQINAVGRAIHLGPRSTLHAPSGQVSLSAGEWRLLGLGGTSPNARFVQSLGQIYLDNDALIDVSGTTGVPVSILQNILTLELRGAELANAPVQRGGILRNAAITVDIRNQGTYFGLPWVGTPLADVTGFAALIQRTIGEFTTPGGEVTLSAGSSVVMRPGSRIDVSGGYIDYQGAMVKTTRLLLNGRLIDIKDATPDRIYDRIYQGTVTVESPRWGVSETYHQALALTGEHWEDSYIHGAPGGRLDIVAPAMALDGEMRGRTIDGPRQREEPAGLSSLRLAFTAQDASFPAFPKFAPTPPSIVFQPGGTLAPAGPFTLDANGDPAPLREDRRNRVLLSPTLLTAGGFGHLTVENDDGDVTVPSGVDLAAPPRGSITLRGANITVAGSVTAPGGSLSFSSANIPLTVVNTTNATRLRPDTRADRGFFRLAPGAIVSTAGLLPDDRASSPTLLPLVIGGGDITIEAFDARLERGSLADVSGGAHIGPRGKITYGDGGSLSIVTGRDLNLPDVLGGKLTLDGELRGYSGARGGQLSLGALAFQIGGGAAADGVVRLDPEFFSTGGFGDFSLTGIGIAGAGPNDFIPGIYIAPGTRIRPIADSWLAVPHTEWGRGLTLRTHTAPEGYRTPVSLSFTATGATDSFDNGNLIARGDVVMGEGASIETDGLGNVSFKGETVTLLGSVTAPGGNIEVSGANTFPFSGEALTTVYLGPRARLDAAGKAIIRAGRNGWREGIVLPGGSISVSGNLVAESGAVLDVSGATGVLDLPATYLTVDSRPILGLKGQRYVPVRIDTNGGSIDLAGGEMLYSDATLIGRPGGPSAIGGSLSVSSGRFIPAGQAFTTADANLVVTQSGRVLPASSFPRGIGLPVRAANGANLPGIGNFTVDRFMAGGFDSLELGGNVRFSGPVNIEAPGSLRVATGGVIYADNRVLLAAPYVAIGRPFQPPALDTDVELRFTQTDATGLTSEYFFPPTHGPGNLIVRADLIDVGDLSLQGIGRAELSAPRGDIRGNGTLQIAGDLILRAGQIYPTTLGQFNVFAYDHAGGPGSVTILRGDQRPLPLSAGGQLAIHASRILQAGTLRAPIGSIRLGWDGEGDAPLNPIAGNSIPAPVTDRLTLAAGSVTSVGAVDPRSGLSLLIPYGISFDGNSWIDPAGNDITVSGVPAKTIQLAGRNVSTQAGSTIDIRGGGDLYAYRWVEGNGGTRDLLASDEIFAVIPNYGFLYAPYAPFNSRASAVNLQRQPGYVNRALSVGDRVTLGSSPGLPAGTYTLLPARYALLPGAVLVSPREGDPVGGFLLDDGSSLVSGYRLNALDGSRRGRTFMERFEVATAEVFRQRAEYLDLTANAFLRDAAVSRGFTAPRLPIDSGYLSFSALAAMSLRGAVDSVAPPGGRGALIDISSPVDIVINRTGTGGGAGNLVLSASQLNAFNAESLLIGGLRTFGTNGASVAVRTGNITVDNAGVPLTGSDIILAATGSIELTDGSSIRGTGSASTLDPLFIGDDAVPGSGDGALVRVSGNTSAPVFRDGVSNSTTPSLTIGANASLSGGSLTLDSTYATDLDPTARLTARNVTLNSGQISVQLDNPGALNPTDGLVLSGQALDSLQRSARRLTLGSYSTLDLYGTGNIGSDALGRLSLQAGAIRGFNTAGGTVAVTADQLLIGNANDAPFTALPAGPLDGSLVFNAGQISLGDNDVHVEEFATVAMNPRTRLLADGTGSFETAGDLVVNTPVVTGAGASNYRLAAAGHLSLNRSPGASAGAGGLGAALAFEGNTVAVNTDLIAPSGQIMVRATGGSLQVGNLAPARIDVGGTTRNFLDLIRHTSGGTVNLVSDTGDVTIDADGSIDVSGPAGGGNAGFLNVNAPNGSFTLNGGINGSAAAGGRAGSFSLDAGSIAGNDLTAIDAQLNAGNFLASRDYRVRSGDLTIGGTATAQNYRLTADAGSITVTGTIDASGQTGGSIDLIAARDLTVRPGALLDASAQAFSSAGKGGDISLTAGAAINGVVDGGALLDLQSGSAIDLSVAAAQPDSESRGRFTGTLHLRAPQNAGFTDVQVAAIGATITDPSSILVEGYRLYDLTGSGLLDNPLLSTIQADGNAFLGAAGVTGANYNAMLGRLTSLQPTLDLILAPGAEVINRSGDLTLGSAVSNTSADWNLAGLRFGPRSAPGVLTLRARDNLTFFNAISDGFNGGPSLWLSPLLANNPLLPDNTESWSYHFTAGSDFSSANARTVLPLDALAPGVGNIELGKNAGSATAVGGTNATTASIIGNAFQVIRTGSGDIDLTAARNVRLLNPFASIYTAGTQVADPNSIFAPNDFVTPLLTSSISQGSLGAVQQTYPAQYSLGGGNVAISAGENIERKTRNNSGLIDDASRQLPNNWLYRRGHVGPDGSFGEVRIGFGFISFVDPAASTSWWVDHSNFFQSVGALGGGDVSLIAGQDVKNVDAVIPTNARSPGGTPDSSRIVELGGGDLLVRSGNDISGGVYYVERGRGELEAGGAITTNAARSPSLGIIQSLNNPESATLDPLTWMPTSLFLGRSTFDVSARGDVLLGPAANPFLLPQGLNNRFWYKTYFSTFGPDSAVNATSLGGDITFRNAVTLPQRTSATGMLRTWMDTQNLLASGPTGAAHSQPWLRLVETNLDPFAALLPIQAPTLEAFALDGDIRLVGNTTLYPSATGQLTLAASGSVSALQPTGVSTVRFPGQTVNVWTAAAVNVSDADPHNVPGLTNPFSYFSLVGSNTSANNLTRAGFLDQIGRLFTESGSTSGIFGLSTTKQALHSVGLPRLADPDPLRVYALGGDLTGLRLFSPKASRIHAGRDISDIAFYLQNLDEDDITTVSAGRDIIPYNASSPTRAAALAGGNALGSDQFPQAGDIHIGGPGSLQVLAGRNLDLGTGATNADGTGAGIISVGNNRNPFLPFEGADLFVGAGIGGAISLANSDIDFDGFITQFVTGGEGEAYLAELGIDDFDNLSDERQAQVALEVFYRILRDAGRNFNDPSSPGFGNYDTGLAAIDALFGGGGQGDILARARNIRTQNGGDISLFAPGGGLTLANTAIGNPLVPPGIVTESGGNVSIFTDGNVDIGIGRIFTLRGGDMIIWSSNGDIAAGAASKTVQSAPPTRVLIDPQSATVETDLAGLATGGGIGVLATVAGIDPGDVDLIAPSGIIDAGDAGIRVTGNINLAATQVVNASNIAVGGAATGAPSAPTVAAPNIGGLSAASSTAGASSAAAAATETAAQQSSSTPTVEKPPSIITVEVIGYGGGSTAPAPRMEEEDDDDEENR